MPGEITEKPGQNHLSDHGQNHTWAKSPATLFHTIGFVVFSCVLLLSTCHLYIYSKNKFFISTDTTNKFQINEIKFSSVTS